MKRAAKKVSAKLHREKAPVEDSHPRLLAKPKPAQQQARPRRPQTDIPFDTLRNAYTPQQTSLKAPFRSSGLEHQRDQQFGRGIDDDRWNDEDRITNKSGDPRIGTHGRTYEPGESRRTKGRK